MRSIKFIKKNNEFGGWKCVKMCWHGNSTAKRIWCSFFFGGEKMQDKLWSTSKLSSGRRLRRIEKNDEPFIRDSNGQ